MSMELVTTDQIDTLLASLPAESPAAAAAPQINGHAVGPVSASVLERAGKYIDAMPPGLRATRAVTAHPPRHAHSGAGIQPIAGGASRFSPAI